MKLRSTTKRLSEKYAKKIFGILTFCLLLNINAFAQDPQFSLQSMTYFNPALAGINPFHNIHINYRNQPWMHGQPYTTQQITASIAFGTKRNIHLGSAGLTLLNDWAGAGTIKTNGAFANLAGNIGFSAEKKHFLSFGLQFGFIQKTIDLSSGWGSQFVEGSGYNPNIGVELSEFENTKLLPIVNSGLVWHYNNTGNIYNHRLSTHIGVSVSNINTPDEAFQSSLENRLSRLYKVHAGYELRIGEKTGIMPYAAYLHQNNITQYNGGLFMHYKLGDAASSSETELSLGAIYRYNNAVLFSAGVGSKFFNVAFGYDMNQSTEGYKNSKTGAYEISLTLQLGKASKSNAPRLPRFQL